MAYITSTCLVKLSIGLFLLRFTIERKYTWTLYGFLTVMISYTIFLLFFALFQCKPVSGFWSSQGTCNRSGTVKVTYAHSVIVKDQLPGISASIATLARFAYVHQLIDPKNLLFDTGLIITSHLEIGIALTASSAATLRPLLVRMKQ
ncbi:hypothetical protein FE257_010396 [Aspergillus nanangensis]|uniref:Rhodopsin domain-containing protein n=1 Tax=Aspergillus nanangensis TaxID=2582783 RepID=A0AAD4CK72_ASPNN|nr:hypothetical protein FE257_010396 [Aspergillus nanangensis]